MKRRAAVTLFLTLAMAGSVTAPAFGADDTPARIPVGKMSEENRGRLTARDFADCLVRKKATWVNRLLALPNPESDRMISKAQELSECLEGGELRFQSNLLRGALFGAKYRLVYKNASLVPAVTPDAVDFYANDRRADLGFYSALWIADCVVGKDADVARRIVLTGPATPANNQAYQSLLPVLSACTAHGVTARFSKATLDGFLAEALYRRTAAAPDQAGDRK